MIEINKEYTNGEVTVVWQPKKCFHSTNCIQGLPEVFDAENRPWIDIHGADTARIIDQVKKCPSGALSCFLNADLEEKDLPTVEVIENGPLKITGKIKIIKEEGQLSIKEGQTLFCRCGASLKKPYCDGKHREIDFEDS
ncbi:MAG: (4Fe-4S)-binding protein [Bacteroidales bacterium]|nr:(4Fe-4S)-binding protein [Bacteroidales bacterium]